MVVTFTNHSPFASPRPKSAKAEHGSRERENGHPHSRFPPDHPWLGRGSGEGRGWPWMVVIHMRPRRLDLLGLSAVSVEICPFHDSYTHTRTPYIRHYTAVNAATVRSYSGCPDYCVSVHTARRMERESHAGLHVHSDSIASRDWLQSVSWPSPVGDSAPPTRPNS